MEVVLEPLPSPGLPMKMGWAHGPIVELTTLTPVSRGPEHLSTLSNTITDLNKNNYIFHLQNNITTNLNNNNYIFHIQNNMM